MLSIAVVLYLKALLICFFKHLLSGDLCAEGRLDEVLLRAYFDHLSTSQGFNDSDGSSGCDGGASVGLDAVHAEFATLFLHQFLNEVSYLMRRQSIPFICTLMPECSYIF